MLKLKEIPAHGECGPDCLCWLLIEMAGGYKNQPRFPFDIRRTKANLEAIQRARGETFDAPVPFLLPPTQIGDLNAQETAILHCIAKGISNRKISRETGLRQDVVRKTIRTISTKLNLYTKPELARYYVNHTTTQETPPNEIP